MGKKFVLEIDLGNAAMERPEEIAEALHRTAYVICGGIGEGTIRDLNGNTVGSFNIVDVEGDND